MPQYPCESEEYYPPLVLAQDVRLSPFSPNPQEIAEMDEALVHFALGGLRAAAPHYMEVSTTIDRFGITLQGTFFCPPHSYKTPPRGQLNTITVHKIPLEEIPESFVARSISRVKRYQFGYDPTMALYVEGQLVSIQDKSTGSIAMKAFVGLHHPTYPGRAYHPEPIIRYMKPVYTRLYNPDAPVMPKGYRLPPTDFFS
jgi:hypothetical protein